MTVRREIDGTMTSSTVYVINVGKCGVLGLPTVA